MDESEVQPSLEDEGIPDLEGPPESKLPSGTGDEGLLPPRDRPRVLNRSGTTATEQRRGEGMEERLGAEVPDEAAEGDWGPAEETAGRLADPDATQTDDEDEALAEATDDRSGRGLLAEERAVHIEEESPD